MMLARKELPVIVSWESSQNSLLTQVRKGGGRGRGVPDLYTRFWGQGGFKNDFEDFYFSYFLDSKFLDFQVPRYLKSGAGGGCPSTALPRAHPRPKPGPTQARFDISGNLEVTKI